MNTSISHTPDTDRNCMINWMDDARFVECMLGPDDVADLGCRRALDFTADQSVDLRDAGLFFNLPR